MAEATSVPLLRLVARVAAGLDRGVVAGSAMRRRFGTRPAEQLGPERRIAGLARLSERYARPEWGDPDVFFPVPEVAPREAPVGVPFSDAEGVELAWVRDYDPVASDVAATYLAHRRNLRFVARWIRRPGSRRPTVVLLHGYLGGQLDWEQRVFPVRRLLAAGLDVVLPALPFHGHRASRGARFPDPDPRWTIEGFRHAITDLRALVALLHDRGAPRVAVWGMSLGGYTTSLLATVEPRLDAAVPIIPLASLADFALEHGRLVGTPEQVRAQHDGIEAVYRVVSPLARPLRIPADRVLILAGRGDRITPPAHARRLADHFACPLEVFPGGHLLQVGLRRRLAQAIALSVS